MKYAICEVLVKGAYLQEMFEDKPAEQWTWMRFSQYDEPEANWILDDPLLFDSKKEAERIRCQVQLRINDIRPDEYQTFVVVEVNQLNLYGFERIVMDVSNEKE